MPRSSIIHPNHPEATQGSLIDYTEQQLAEIASVDPETAAKLALAYANATDASEAQAIGFDIENTRLEVKEKL